MKIKKNPILDVRGIPNLRELIDGNAISYGDKPIYIYKENKEEKRISYAEYRDLINSIGTGFISLGLPEAAVAITGAAHPCYIASYYAAILGGGIAVPLDAEISENEMVNFINISGAQAIVYTERFNGKLLKRAADMPKVKYFLPIQPDATETGENVVAFSDLVAIGRAAIDSGDNSFSMREQNLDKCANIIFTSGTTGTSKGVMTTQRNIASCAWSACHAIEWVTSEDSIVAVLPTHHTYEMLCTHTAAPYFGVTIMLNDSLKYVLQNFKKYSPSVMVLVPLFLETMHKKIWEEAKKKGIEKKLKSAIKLSNALLKVGIDLRRKLFKEIINSFGGRVAHVIAGGAKVNPQLIKDFNSFGITIQEGYGITECSPLVAVNVLGSERLGSVGRPVVNEQVKIDFEGQSGNAEGEILIKGPNVMPGYFNNPDATAAVFTEDGWFRSGDYGYIDKDGYVFITGRKKNIIILSNGKNIYPEELEEHLSVVEKIGEVVVVGRNFKDETEHIEQVITALIYPNPDLTAGLSKEELHTLFKNEINAVNRTLPPYKHIAEVEIRDTEFPKTTTKKIKRQGL